MHACEIDVREDSAFDTLMIEALYLGAKHVEALENQRKRQLEA